MNATAIRALVVEDDSSWQQILSEIITDAGLMVDIAASSEEAISQLRLASHRLAVVDLSLGGGDYHNQDGLAVLGALRRHDPGCVSVLLTGFATVELAVRALTEYNTFSCLRKEAFIRADFRDLIDRALASTPPWDEPGDGLGPQAPKTQHTPARRDEGTVPGRALVVEDDAGWRGILSELLTDAGYQVSACASFGEALGRFRREAYTLAVVDLALEGSLYSDLTAWHRCLEEEDGLTGYRLLASTRAGGIPTIVVSGVASPANVERAYDEHAVFAFFEKQAFDRRAFLHTVEEARISGRPAAELEHLTDREHEVLALLAQGLTNKEIAQALVITTNTVKRHLKAIFTKLEVHTRAAATAKAVSAGVAAGWSAVNEAREE